MITLIKKIIEYLKKLFNIQAKIQISPAEDTGIPPPSVSSVALEQMQEEELLLKTFERVFNAVGRISKKQRKLYKQDPLLELDDGHDKSQNLRGVGRKLFGGSKKNR